MNWLAKLTLLVLIVSVAVPLGDRLLNWRETTLAERALTADARFEVRLEACFGGARFWITSSLASSLVSFPLAIDSHFLS